MAHCQGSTVPVWTFLGWGGTAGVRRALLAQAVHLAKAPTMPCTPPAHTDPWWSRTLIVSIKTSCPKLSLSKDLLLLRQYPSPPPLKKVMEDGAPPATAALGAVLL